MSGETPVAANRDTLPDRNRADVEISESVTVLKYLGVGTDLDNNIVVEVSHPIRRDNGCTSYCQEISAARDNVAMYGVLIDAGYA